MKIATYNIWNSESLAVRAEQLIQEINSVSADIIGLQEVPSGFYEALIRGTNYAHNVFRAYQNDDEGLAFLSKYPIVEQYFLNRWHVPSILPHFSNSFALNIF